MKNIFIPALCALGLILSGCAKKVEEGVNTANKRYFDAWMQINYQDLAPQGLGYYIIEETEGTGAEVKADGYAIVDCIASELDGTIGSYTSAEVARQLGEYDPTHYYGPQVWLTFEETLYAGLKDALLGVKAGGRRKVVIPCWLMNYNAYGSAQEYLDEETKYSDAIYDFTVKDFTDDMSQWQIDSIGRFFTNTSIYIDGKTPAEIFKTDAGAPMAAADSVRNGFYYKRLSNDTDTEATFPADTTIYINYTGRLLNGLVFDTTIEKVAKDNDLYSASKTYQPVAINWGEAYTDITMGSDKSDIISGFALTLWQMHPYEKGVGVFFSNLGYGTSGSGDSIPSYAPLIFEIEIVDAPEEQE